MKYLPKNTIAYFASAPQYHRVELGEISIKHFAAATKKYRSDCGQVDPGQSAQLFYTLNHLVSLVRKTHTPNEPLPEWATTIYQAYLETTMAQSTRMLHYILSICTREMRHLQTDSLTESWWKNCSEQFSHEFKQFLQNSICAASENVAVERYMSKPPDCTIGEYIGGLSWAFHKGKWTSGYGGKAWGAVADACVAFVKGKISMEALVDTGYTLAHNNGPIFNKGMMYNSYDSAFIMLLDVQRSGQMPELMLDPYKYPLGKSEGAIKAVELVKGVMPQEFRGWVDWVAVEAKGSVAKYSVYKAAQLKAHPPNMIFKKPPVASPAKTNVTKMKEVGKFTYWPGKTVPKMERVKV